MTGVQTCALPICFPVTIVGVESPSAPKVKPVKDKKSAKVKDQTELVDKANQMKTPKGVEKIKASANKAHKETNKMVKGVQELTHTAKRAKGIKQVMSPTGSKMKTIKENLFEDHAFDRESQIAFIEKSGHYNGDLSNYRDWETDRKSTRLNSSHRL